GRHSEHALRIRRSVPRELPRRRARLPDRRHPDAGHERARPARGAAGAWLHAAGDRDQRPRRRGIAAAAGPAPDGRTGREAVLARAAEGHAGALRRLKAYRPGQWTSGTIVLSGRVTGVQPRPVRTTVPLVHWPADAASACAITVRAASRPDRRRRWAAARRRAGPRRARLFSGGTAPPSTPQSAPPVRAARRDCAARGDR